MTKKESLDFLDSCIDYIDHLSPKEILNIFESCDCGISNQYSDFETMLYSLNNFNCRTIENNSFLNVNDMFSKNNLSYNFNGGLADLSKSTYNNAA